MAVQLVRDMTGKWNPDDYADKFTTAIHALAAQRVKAGKTEKVTPLEDAGAVSSGSNVVDLTELLKKSLATRKTGGDATARATRQRRQRRRARRRRARRQRQRRALRRRRQSVPPEALT
jgi:DNA end-binding protein Ku